MTTYVELDIGKQKKENKCTPNYLACTYCHQDFAVGEWKDDEDKFTIEDLSVAGKRKDSARLVVSTLLDKPLVELKWKGYEWSIHNGSLGLWPIPGSNPQCYGYVTIDSKTVTFLFEGYELKEGKWPGFLCMLDHKISK